MINDRIHKLLEENKGKLLNADKSGQISKNGICYDGIVNEELFAETGRVMFLLKETNGNDSTGQTQECSDWEYRGWLEYQQHKNIEKPNYGECKFYRTFYNLSMWVDIFTSAKNENSYQEYLHSGGMEENNLRYNLGKAAIVNMKKTWGGGTTDWKNLNDYIQCETVKEVLKKQIEYIAPKLVVCGSSEVYHLAKKIWDIAYEEKIMAMGKETHFFEYAGIVFLEFYHPSCRKKREFLYDYCKTVKEEINIKASITKNRMA